MTVGVRVCVSVTGDRAAKSASPSRAEATSAETTPSRAAEPSPDRAAPNRAAAGRAAEAVSGVPLPDLSDVSKCVSIGTQQYSDLVMLHKH